jgi:hypothetical protein
VVVAPAMRSMLLMMKVWIPVKCAVIDGQKCRSLGTLACAGPSLFV